MHVVRGDEVDPGACGKLSQTIVSYGIEWIAVVPELNDHMVTPKGVDQTIELSCSRSRPFMQQRSGHRALAATGENFPVRSRRLPVGKRRQPGRGRYRPGPGPRPHGGVPADGLINSGVVGHRFVEYPDLKCRQNGVTGNRHFR